MSRTIRTIDSDIWSEPDERRRVQHLGMIKAKDAFEQLYTHLQANNMLPDDYFLFSENDFRNDAELPEFNTAVCHTDFGGSEGIYIDIDLFCVDGKSVHFATGKTLDDDADTFFKMSRIAAECSLMLNGRGGKFQVQNTELSLSPDECKALESAVNEKLSKSMDSPKTDVLLQLLDKVSVTGIPTDVSNECEQGLEP